MLTNHPSYSKHTQTKKFNNIYDPSGLKNEKYHVNPCPAEPGYVLKKPTDLDLHCALFVIQFVNLYQQPGSSNLIGWKLAMGVASQFIQQDKG